MELFLAVKVARALRHPSDSEDQAGYGKGESVDGVDLPVTENEPELQCDPGHDKSKDHKNVQARRILVS